MALYTYFLNEQVIIVFRLCLLVMMIIRESLSNNVEHFLSTCWLPYHICVNLLDFARSTRVPFQKNRFAHSLALQASWSSFHQAQLHGIMSVALWIDSRLLGLRVQQLLSCCAFYPVEAAKTWKWKGRDLIWDQLSSTLAAMQRVSVREPFCLCSTTVGWTSPELGE